MAADLSVELCGVKMRNPTVLASGFLGVTGASLASVAKAGAGAVTMKSVSLEPRKGHPNPVIVEFGGGLINAVGLSNAGIDEALAELKYAKKHAGVPVIASIFGGKASEYAELAKRVSQANPDLIEVNISCPNVASEFGTPFAADPEAAADVTKKTKAATSIPIAVKLSPIPAIARVAKAVEQAGADAITAANTAGPGMVIDLESRKPVLANKCGGVSGPAIRPLAVKSVYDVYEAVKIPIIGTGGVSTGRDAIEMFMAGATCVGIGSAIHYRGIDVFKTMCGEMQEWMDSQGVSSLKEIRGTAHE